MRTIQTLFFTLLCVGITTSALSAKTFFVKADGTGNGQSWAAATADLQAVLQQATTGDQIWIARGTYTPARRNRDATFFIPTGVQVYGGFAGTETRLDQRNAATNRTVLSGEIGAPGTEDNTYTVVTFRQATPTTILDGVVISGGNADADTETGSAQRCGGGLFNDGSNGSSTPTISACIFENNEARDGGAVYNLGRAGISSPSFTNCTFRKNTADLDGGAVYNDGRQRGNSSPTFSDCVFEENLATYGAAIFVGQGNAGCEFLVRNCTFERNAAYLWGGGIYGLTADDCKMNLSYCRFVDNYPTNINKRYTFAQNIEDVATLMANK